MRPHCAVIKTYRRIFYASIIQKFNENGAINKKNLDNNGVKKNKEFKYHFSLYILHPVCILMIAKPTCMILCEHLAVA